MAVVPPPTMGDYCKRTSEGYVSRGFIPANPTNFDIRKYVISCLRYNTFNVNAITDLWENLACIYETTLMCRPNYITED